MAATVGSRLGAALVAAALLAGCGTAPADPDRTLERVRSAGEVVVGAAAAPPVLVVTGESVTGPEASVVEEWARTQGVRVRWVPGGLEDLVALLEEGRIDLLVGGLTDATPFDQKIGVSRPYTEDADAVGRPVKRVVAVPLGENGLLYALETYFEARR